MKVRSFFCISMLFALLCSGCAQQAQMPVTAQTVPLDERPAAAFALVPGDEIEVKFVDRPQWNETLRIRPDGYIDLLQLGSIKAIGLQPEELSNQIADAYRKLGGNAATAGEFNYLLAVGDELDIRLPFHDGLDQNVKIRPDGRISLALAGTVVAAGKTPEDLEKELNARYAKSLRKPQVSVSLRNFSSLQVQGPGGAALAGVRNLKPSVQLRTPVPRQVYIGGEVLRPGALNYRQGLSVLQAVVEAGGLKSASAGARTMVMRKTDAGVTLIPVDISTLDSYKVTAPQDLALQPFDVVVIPKTALAAAADGVDAVFNLLPPLRNSTFGLIYQIDPKTNVNR